MKKFGMNQIMNFLDPFVAIKGGFDVHCYYEENPEQKKLCFLVYDGLLKFLKTHNIIPTYTSFTEKRNDPHIFPGFTVQILGVNPSRDVPQIGCTYNATDALGLVVAWLQLNRNGLRILIHPNVAKPVDDVEEEIKDHTLRAIWLGCEDSKKINEVFSIDFFENLI